MKSINFSGVGKWLRKFLDMIQVRPLVGGLEISDAALRFVFWDGIHWEARALRLPPGVVIAGKVEKKEEMIAALSSLRAQVLGSKARSRRYLNAIVSLSSVNIYTQIFNLPPIEGDNLEKAIQLNIQMASPTGSSDSYAGWQLVNKENDLRLEILSAFLGRDIVDELTGILKEAKFLPVAIESRALALARVAKESMGTARVEESVILVGVDASGVDVMVVRHGHLHFDYFNSWHDLQGDAKEISEEAFRAAIVRNVHQVFNFHNSHWQDPVTAILVASSGMQEEVKKILTENFQVPIETLVLQTEPPLGPEWLIALGGALRGKKSRREDSEISLLGIDAQEEFRREQIVGFINFWRVLAPSALALLLAVFIGAYIFLSNESESLAAKASLNFGGKEAAIIADLQREANAFNQSVSFVNQIEANINSRIPALDELLNVTQAHNIIVNRITTQSSSGAMTLSGRAKSSDDVVSFKTDLEKNPAFKNINLPVTDIQGDSVNGYSFSVSFIAISLKTD